MISKRRRAPDINEFRSLLKKYSLKATPQRLAVHEAMLELGHASADMVAATVEKHGKARVTVASVYNILSQLALLGIYSHRLSSTNKMFFDVNTFNHLHLYDTVNNTYKDVIDDELFGIVLSKISHRRFKGYKVDGVDIQILCHPTKRNGQAIS